MPGRCATVVCVVLAACTQTTPQLSAPNAIEVVSPAISPGAPIPQRYTCEGDDVSPPLEWSAVDGAEGYAVTMIDPDARGFVHWVLYGLPGSVTALGEGETPGGARTGRNDFGRRGYGGPCPPPGRGPHRYVITVYAQRAAALPPAGADLRALLAAIDDAVIAKGELSGTYER